MSTVVVPKGHGHSRSAALPSSATSSQSPQNLHYLNSQAQNSQSEMSDSVQSNPTTPPRTPRRNDQSISKHGTTNLTAQEIGSKQKPRNKNRPKNVMTSPPVTRNERNTPPLTGAQSAAMPSSTKPISTPSSAAYAGPTFHASPAPSALPIPSFYSKSVPDSPGLKGLRSLKDASLSASPTPQPVSASNTPFQPNAQIQREESPLDFFFKADREEKARARSASSTQNAVFATGPFHPPSQSPRTSQTPPASRSQDPTRHASKESSNGIFAMELDGEKSLGTRIGPAFSTPYAERINAARSCSQSEDAQAAIEKSEALKAYLFSGQPLHSPATPSSNPFNTSEPASPLPTTSSAAYQNPSGPLGGSRIVGLPPRSQYSHHSFSYDQKPSSHAPRTSGRSSGLRQEVTPTRTPTRTPSKTPDRNPAYSTPPTPSRTYFTTSSSHTNDFNKKFEPPTASSVQGSPYVVASGNESADLQGMEESLRKILKLDSSRSSDVTGSSIGSVRATAVSAPDYVGGRPTTINDVHNGVMGS